MNQQTDKPLLILNASAGSGKTYNLVFQYLKILVKSEFSYQNFKHILAMTFTNKAANEMKERVIKALDVMARSTESEVLPDAISLFEKLEDELGVTKATLIHRAQKSLQSLLHTYEDFHVMTIDKFNLKLIRNFSRDLDLPGQFEIEMNTDLLTEKLVDHLLNKVGEKDLEELTEIVFSYAKSNLDDGEKWDVKAILVDFAKILTKESVFPLLDKIMAKKYDQTLFHNWIKHRNELNKGYIKRGSRVYELVNQLGMTSKATPNGSTAFNQLMKLNSLKSLAEKQPVTDKMAESLLEEPKKDKFVPLEFQHAFREYLTFYHDNLREFNLVSMFTKNFHSMALLKFMHQFLDEIKQQEQIIQISEFNKLISELIQQSHAPYIYERIGTKFNHYLLDEFQDTSRMQWMNLIHLVDESLGHNHLNFIVGDPKQSIYRFRNGVAEQFVELPRIYNPENLAEIEAKSNIFEQRGVVIPLLENWRSAKQVVHFNNNFFELFKLELSETAQKYYDPVSQIPTSKSDGFVSIESNKEKLDLAERMDKIVAIIENCDQSHFRRGDICILHDTNKKLNLWAIELLKRGISVVSGDSLFVNNEPRVRLTISYLKRRLDPKNKTEMKKFADLFFRMNSNKTQGDYWKYFVEKDINGKKVKYFDDILFIQENFENNQSFFASYETLYSLIQHFYRKMGWFEEKNAYLHHLADVVYQYEQNNSSDLRGFIDYYNKHNEKMSVQLPESDNSIKLMTIHKAKGLEFPVVILPDIDFDTRVKYWSKQLIEVNDTFIYSSLSKESSIQEIADAHAKESGQILTDKVNLCYVAFTRARERLYVINYFQGTNLGSLAHSTFKKLSNSNSDDLLVHEQGNEGVNPKYQGSNTVEIKSDFFEPKIVSDNLWFPDIAIRQDEFLNELSVEQKFGNAFHLLMSGCDSQEEIDSVLETLILQDEIPAELKAELRAKGLRAFELMKSKGILMDAQTVMNETSIIVARDSIKRPDKLILKSEETILIDFKTGAENPKYLKQINEYASALKEMNLPKIKAYLYYTNTESLQEVMCE
jgi:ATP-dependent exoDNAse (exonuclease V) beta subunit